MENPFHFRLRICMTALPGKAAQHDFKTAVKYLELDWAWGGKELRQGETAANLASERCGPRGRYYKRGPIQVKENINL
jgi:hypothetical protein